MATISFDTDAINYFVKNNLYGDDIKNFIFKNNRLPIIGANTLCELLDTYTTSEEQLADSLCSFINKLDPDFVHSRDVLYKMEGLKLKDGHLVNPYRSREEKEVILQNLASYKSGQRTGLLEALRKWKESFITGIEAWAPQDRKHEYKKIGTFSERVEKLPNTPETKSQLQKLFKLVGVDASELEIEKFLSNQADYPALRALLRTRLYLDYSAEKNQQTPHKNRITDSLQLTEASYSVTFVSNDRWLLKNGNWINPDIEVISAEEFVKSMRPD